MSDTNPKILLMIGIAVTLSSKKYFKNVMDYKRMLEFSWLVVVILS